MDNRSLLGENKDDRIYEYDHSYSPRKRRIIFWAVAISIAVAVIVGISVGLAVGLRKDDSNSASDFRTTFLNSVSSSSIEDFIMDFSSVSHIAGSADDHQQALKTQSTLESWGYSTRIQEIPTLLTYPISRLVEITYPADKKYTCQMEELPIAEDETSSKPAIATFNGYSAAGDVTAELVYVNYGREEDFAYLDNKNISVAGKIVIVRYGKIFRGNKVDSAERRGAVGVLIYIDPADSGYVQGPEYIEGPWSTNTTVQRGSISLGQGDPETPGWPSSWTGPRLTVDQAKNSSFTTTPLPKIPVQPLSYGDAAPLLAAMGGNGLPIPDWQGGLNFTYFVGPGPVQVHLQLEVNYTVTPVWNVLGMIEGSEEPDRYVLLGCHRDAWTFGAGDPISGHSVLMEIARVFSELNKQGWKPRRSIVIASWDAEEYALIGSVEFVESYYSTLQARSVAYINLDVAVSGTDYFDAQGSWSFQTLLEEATAAADVGNKKVSDIWNKVIKPAGGGSDFVPFIHHAGISTLYPNFESFDNHYDAVYHSNYDSYYWYTSFGDPEWIYHPAMAKVVGYVVMRLADSPVIPLDLTYYAEAIGQSVVSLQNMTDSISFSVLQNSSNNLIAAVAQFQKVIDQASTGNPSQQFLRSVNDRIMYFERAFLTDDPELTGGSTWYKHVVYASSTTDWYSGVSFGPLVDAINLQQWEQAEYLVGRISLILDNAAFTLSNNPFGL